MKAKTLTCLVISFGLALPALSVAEPTTRKHGKHRGRHQEKRIHEGVRSGELTKDEAKELQSEQRGIRQQRREALKDGKLTPEERKQLEEARDKASENIYEEKHDDEERQKAQ